MLRDFLNTLFSCLYTKVISPQRGATLFSTSVMVTTVGLLVGAAVPLAKIYDQKQKMLVSAERQQAIHAAMESYIAVNNRLPCPSRLDSNMDTAHFGREINNGAGCNSASDISDGLYLRQGRNGGIVQIGAVPVRTLGLGDENMVDGYGKRFVYAVSAHFTVSGADFQKDDGAINLVDSNSNFVSSTPGNIIYTIFAKGDDNHGAYNVDGYEIAPCRKLDAGDSECFEDGTIRVSMNKTLNSDVSTFTYMASAKQYRWERTYGSCGCPNKQRSATVQCVSLDVAQSDPGRIVADANCLGEKPDDSPADCSGEIMEVGNCFGWFTPSWGNCPCDSSISRTSRCVERNRNGGSLMSQISITAQSCDRESDIRPFPIVETMNCAACPPPPEPEFDNDGGDDGGGDGGDPLVLDLNGDGIHLTALNESVWFDMNNDGIRDQSAWLGPDDGLLFLDRNENGTVDGQIELFGDMEKGIGAYQDLSQYDENGDGLITAADYIWDKLQVWQDANVDAHSTPEELQSLDAWGITEISLGYATVAETQSGNDVKAKGTFTRVVNGLQTVKASIIEVWFKFFES